MTSSSDLASLLVRCRKGMAAVLQQSSGRPERAGALADLLRESVPQSVMTACLLSSEGARVLAVRPASNPEQERLLQSKLSILDPLADQILKLCDEILPDVQILASAIHTDGRPRGFLIVGLSVGASEEEIAQAEVLLTVAASTLALRWSLESLQREQLELARFALVGQAFIGLTHELNNLLNSMMLQTSVVQLRVDQQARQDLAAIRQHGAQAAAVVRALQHIVQERREQSYAVDLNSVLAEILEEDADLRRRVSLNFSQKNLEIQSTHSAVKQLLHLLLEGVCAATVSAVQAMTSEQQGSVVLSLTIPRSGGDAPTIETLLWQNLDEVGRLAGQSLLRQLGGTLAAERTGDVLILRVEWK